MIEADNKSDLIICWILCNMPTTRAIDLFCLVVRLVYLVDYYVVRLREGVN